MLNSTECKWLVNRTNPEYVDYISRVATVSPAFAQVLINRGIKTPEQLDSFLNSDINKLSDPFELPCIKIAIDRIREAKRQGERVLVHGDYDADGVTATAIMVEGLRKIGLDVHYFIPNRMSHGYGFGSAGIEKAKEVDAKLIITVDCGITSFDAVSEANSLGIDVIITDHHEPLQHSNTPALQFQLPEAFAIVNPKLLTHNSQLSILSGAGVAFKLIHGLFENNIDDVYELFDLAAIGTAADVVPVVGDNRVILKEGIKLIQSGERAGIRALKDASGIRPDFFKTSFLYYTIIPRINAAGRMSDATDVVRLLTTKSEAEAEELSKWLNELNSKRQEIEGSVYDDAIEMLNLMGNSHGAIVLASEGWHHGVVGIVASRIAEQYYRPTFILSIENGVAKGSARSIPSFDIHCGLTLCKDILKRFGGHKQAAGLSLSLEDIERFRLRISEVVNNALSDNDFIPALHIDAVVNISDISIGLIDELARLEPFGCGNEEPLFGAKGLEAIKPRVVGNNHLKMHLKQNGRRIDSIGFDFGGLLDSIEDNPLIDAAFLPIINEWDGGRYLQLNLKAIRPNQSNGVME
ncbi:MAG: single-stranded-DNA-specific exonuclease RecJ [Nitrospiraceae bacterium]|nr:single-stranded-DNA-specific exonuclease RecJ [Nitrospirota bacterium]MDA8215668.1 single-stranded-DNA-specific exonuclease RecJ [Nitrospiraceae bacterium]MDA8338123.1 single-stranded-DNA-specific exonuclease RecJ [Nitrospiraceae bacterium]